MVKGELLIPGRIKGTRVRVNVYLRPREHHKILRNEDIVPTYRRAFPWWKKALKKMRLMK